MKTIQLHKFKYTLLENQADVTGMPLMNNLFGINNRIYVNLGSYNLSDEDRVEYSKHFAKEELEYPLLNRLLQVHIKTRTHADVYDTIESIDFKDLFTFIKEKYEKFDQVFATYNGSGNKTDEEKGVLYLPLNSKVLRDGCNYTAQQIELLKMENFILDFSNMHHLNNFLNLF